MNILQLTVHFSPNIGGVETHLDDLCKALIDRKLKVFVLTYRPLEADTAWKIYEKKNQLEILRLPWVKGFFYKFIKYPLMEFIYLFPGLFILTPFIIFYKKIDVIHAHGIVAGFVGVFWGKILRKKIVISTHSIYGFPEKGFYKKFVCGIFSNASYCLVLSKQSKRELERLGVSSKKIIKFTYWIDLLNFKKINGAKKILGWQGFNVLFVGRLIEEKGIKELLKSAETWDRRIKLNIIGTGPFSSKIKILSSKNSNINFLGVIDQKKLPLYYSGVDLLIVPTVSEEGFGRVIIESLACGTPVIASSREGIYEVMDEQVGRFMDADNTITSLFKDRTILKELADNCRPFVERRYSEKNVKEIIKTYNK